MKSALIGISSRNSQHTVFPSISCDCALLSVYLIRAKIAMPLDAVDELSELETQQLDTHPSHPRLFTFGF